jgi:hypothetical protein
MLKYGFIRREYAGRGGLMQRTRAETGAQESKRGRGGRWLRRLIPLGLVVVAAAVVGLIAWMPDE